MSAAVPDGHGPSRSVEIERKFDVEAGTPVPDWIGVQGVAAVSAGEERHLDALYLDTDDLALGRAGVALRRRTGGPDAGWHIKGPLVDGGRTELGWPLSDGDAVPDEVAAEVARWSTEGLSPLARIVNDRTAYALLDADGGVIAEFVDDHVRATDLRGGATREWHEWEVELGPAASSDPTARESFFAAVADAAHAAGARPAGSSSKLARALGR
ncbi:CYTH domain-containing protein [Microbacterium marinilacus]|uniref:CYTH domain-containing protein n=1 Tax=Microbacterium marinilacus TaxID=415209 RepID=A0ABP7B489_9MICO|nr:CYTH domain-containing protein [Microbacterium marinilacus]MBY0687779.1 CYTH domain-containing protein [Microbacterium marinilacus]